MRISNKLCVGMALALVMAVGPAAAQDKNVKDAAARKTRPGKSAYRVLAPGVETTVPVQRDEAETVDSHDVVELLQGVPGLEWTPSTLAKASTLLERSKKVNFRRAVWNLELSFKPLRMMTIDLPQSGGKLARKQLWYLVYRVKNNGKHLSPQRQDDGSYLVKSVDKLPEPIYFFPQFILSSHEYDKEYLDQVIPTAVRAIQKREDPNRKLLSSVEISAKPIPLSTEREDNSVWGVAIWEEIDPRIDFFSIQVRGLTNAYRWADAPAGTPDAFKPGDAIGKGRTMTKRMLKLNFWRPGDEFSPHEEEFRFGIPGQVDSEWVWR